MGAVMVRWVSRFAADLIMCQCPKHLSKGHASMPSRYLHRPILCAFPALVAGVLAACGGRGPLDTDIESYDSPDAAVRAFCRLGRCMGDAADSIGIRGHSELFMRSESNLVQTHDASKKFQR